MSAPLQRVLFTGGGSAGHVVPCLPLMEALRARAVAVFFVGSRSGLEERLVAPLDVRFFGIDTGKLRRYWSIENLLDVARIARGLVQAWRVLRRVHPDVVFSKGGFVSFPTVVAAWLQRIPVVAHESDLTPGLANRLALPFVTVVATTFAETRISRRSVQQVHTGTPVRRELRDGSAARGRAFVGAGDVRPVLLAVGGSLGAEALNRAVRDALPRLRERFHMVHVCGPGRLEPRLDGVAHYTQLEYVSAEWGDVLACADVVVSRAGANTLYELVTLGKPNVLVPLSLRASRGDQLDNARYAERRGWSRVLDEDTLTPERLQAVVEETLTHRERHEKAMAEAGLADATPALLAEIERVHAQRGTK